MTKLFAYITMVITSIMGLSPLLIHLVFGPEFARGNKLAERIYIEPAAYSFLVWIVISVGFAALGIYQALPDQIYEKRFQKARKYIFLNGISFLCWVIDIGFNCMTFLLGWAIIVFFTLFQLTNILELGVPTKDKWEKYFVKVPLGIYFGWITLMLPMSTVLFLLFNQNVVDITYINSEIGSVLILLTAFLIAVYLFLRQKVNLNYILVIIWGLFAIFIANISISDIVSLSALSLCVGLLLTYFIVEKQQMELKKIEMELTVLRNQVNPHFLFNSLNTLSNLIPLESYQAHNYLDKLAKFYRYIVSRREGHLIPLQEELAGVNHYIAILKERFGENLHVEIDCPSIHDKNLLPLSLQLLIENAVKHNAISDEHQLWIKIYLSPSADQLNVENNINERIHTLASTGMGLQNIRKRYKHMTKKKVEVRSNNHVFSVSLPLIDKDYEDFNYRRRN